MKSLAPRREPAPVSAADRRTRDRVAALLYEAGPQTASTLGERLGLTAGAVRRHLDALLADGSLETYESRAWRRRGRGRPARLFALSAAGYARVPQSVDATPADDLATSALRFLERWAGEEAVVEFARARGEELEGRYADRLGTGPTAQRAEALAQALAADGYSASVERAGTGVQVCQHHCPVQHVAERFPQLCEAETEAFSRLLGTHVQRLATIAHGDGVCTTHVPLEPDNRRTSA